MLNEREEAVFAPTTVEPQGFTRRHRVTFIVLGLLLLLVLLLVWFVQRQQANAPKNMGRFGMNGPISVAIATVATGDIQVRIPALGTITPLATVTVRTQISGVLQEIAFQEGQLVKKGDFLALVDPRPYQAAVAQAEGTLRRDQALLADARVDLQRYEELIKQDSVAQQQVDTQRALVSQYIGTVEADQAQVRTAKLNLEYTRIVAPVAGRVGLRQVDAGNYITAGDSNGIVVVTQLQPITALFSIPEDRVTPIMKRLHAGATLTADAYDRGNSSLLAEGKVLTVDNQIDVTTGTVKLRALFDNQDGLLFPNQFVNIQLQQEVLQEQIIMPTSAIRRGAPNGVQSAFVYLVNSADSTVSVRPITVGVIDGERVAVTAGLKPGDVVVTDGGDRLRDGSQVNLPSAQPAQGGPSAKPPQGANGKHRRHKPPADAKPQ